MTPERIAELRRLDEEYFIAFCEKGEPSPLSDEWTEMLDEIERSRAVVASVEGLADYWERGRSIPPQRLRELRSATRGEEL